MIRQRGMSIVVALFLIVVVASLAAFAVNIGASEHQNGNLTMRGNRALAAARTGLEWAAYRAKVGGLCEANRVVPLNEGALRGFQLTIQCTRTQHADVIPNPFTYEIIVTAQYGAFGSTDFVSRQIRARLFSPPY